MIENFKKQQRKSEKKILAKQGRSHHLSPWRWCWWRIFKGSHGFQRVDLRKLFVLSHCKYFRIYDLFV